MQVDDPDRIVEHLSEETVRQMMDDLVGCLLGMLGVKVPVSARPATPRLRLVGTAKADAGTQEEGGKQ